MKIAGNGVGDTMWKVPGVLDWATMTHNPFVDVTKDTTTLYASDRDVFLFLVDDTHPIEQDACQTATPTFISGVSIAGIVKSDRRPSGSPLSISGRFA